MQTSSVLFPSSPQLLRLSLLTIPESKIQRWTWTGHRSSLSCNSIVSLADYLHKRYMVHCTCQHSQTDIRRIYLLWSVTSTTYIGRVMSFAKLANAAFYPVERIRRAVSSPPIGHHYLLASVVSTAALAALASALLALRASALLVIRYFF